MVWEYVDFCTVYCREEFEYEAVSTLGVKPDCWQKASETIQQMNRDLRNLSIYPKHGDVSGLTDKERCEFARQACEDFSARYKEAAQKIIDHYKKRLSEMGCLVPPKKHDRCVAEYRKKNPYYVVERNLPSLAWIINKYEKDKKPVDSSGETGKGERSVLKKKEPRTAKKRPWVVETLLLAGLIVVVLLLYCLINTDDSAGGPNYEDGHSANEGTSTVQNNVYGSEANTVSEEWEYSAIKASVVDDKWIHIELTDNRIPNGYTISETPGKMDPWWNVIFWFDATTCMHINIQGYDGRASWNTMETDYFLTIKDKTYSENHAFEYTLEGNTFIFDVSIPEIIKFSAYDVSMLTVNHSTEKENYSEGYDVYCDFSEMEDSPGDEATSQGTVLIDNEQLTFIAEGDHLIYLKLKEVGELSMLGYDTLRVYLHYYGEGMPIHIDLDEVKKENNSWELRAEIPRDWPNAYETVAISVDLCVDDQVKTRLYELIKTELWDSFYDD